MSGSLASDSPADRPAHWAEPLDFDGLPNLHRVTNDLYRSAQPTREGMQNLRDMGVETVVNLRSFRSDRYRLDGLGLAYEHIYMKAWRPEEKEVIRFLQIVTNPKRTPVLVHCRHGADRTGTMCVLYRRIVEGWSLDDAITEMRQGGFGFHRVWRNLPAWLERLDMDAIVAAAGVTRG